MFIFIFLLCSSAIFGQDDYYFKFRHALSERRFDDAQNLLHKDNFLINRTEITPDGQEISILQKMILWGNASAVAWLLEREADPNFQAYNGASQINTEHGNYYVLLLGKSPLHTWVDAFENHYDTEPKEILNALLRANISLEQKYLHVEKWSVDPSDTPNIVTLHSSPAQYAVASGKEKAYELLLAAMIKQTFSMNREKLIAFHSSLLEEQELCNAIQARLAHLALYTLLSNSQIDMPYHFLTKIVDEIAFHKKGIYEAWEQYSPLLVQDNKGFTYPSKFISKPSLVTLRELPGGIFVIDKNIVPTEIYQHYKSIITAPLNPIRKIECENGIVKKGNIRIYA